MSFIEALGYVASFLTTVSFVPQAASSIAPVAKAMYLMVIASLPKPDFGEISPAMQLASFHTVWN